jgi:hypothetical protein
MTSIIFKNYVSVHAFLLGFIVLLGGLPMRKVYVSGIMISFITLLCTGAVLSKHWPDKQWEGAAVFQQQAGGIYVSRLPEYTIDTIYNGSVSLDAWGFSPDGRRIAFVENQKLWVINNDGTNKELLHEFSDDHWYPELGSIRTSWTEDGIMWFSDDRFWRFIPETGELEALPGTMREWSDTACGHGYNIMDRLWVSRDGHRMWSISSYRPSEGYINVDWNHDSIYCGVRGYHHRGGRPFFQWDKDYTQPWIVWHTDWGHADGMTKDGYLFLGRYGTHNSYFVCRQYQDTLHWLNDDSLDDGGWTSGDIFDYKPAWPYDNMESRNLNNCANNDSIVGTYTYFPDYPDYGEDGFMHLYAWNWRTQEFLGEFNIIDSANGKAISQRRITLWEGALPPPYANPHIWLGESDLIFVVDTTQGAPAAQYVRVANNGTGELGTLSASSDANWLDVEVIDVSADSQQIENTIVLNNLSGDKSDATVTVSSANAPDDVTYNVTAYTGATVPKPGDIHVSATGDSMLDAEITWTDNATNEDGYYIERKKGSEDWVRIATLSANSESYTDVHLAYHTTYTYRVQAYLTLEQNVIRESEYSDEVQQTISGVPWVRILNPAPDQIVKSGEPLTIEWEANKIDQIKILLSYNQWLSDTQLTDGGIRTGTSFWPGDVGAWTWNDVPDTNHGIVSLMVVDYEETYDPAIVNISINKEYGGILLDGSQYISRLMRLEKSEGGDNAQYVSNDITSAFENRYIGQDVSLPHSKDTVTLGGNAYTWYVRKDGDGIWANNNDMEDKAVFYHMLVGAPQSMQVKLGVQHDDDLTVWKNGALWQEISYAGQGESLTDNMTLEQGENVLFFKLYESSGGNKFSVRILDTLGQPIDSLTMGFRGSLAAVPTEVKKDCCTRAAVARAQNISVQPHRGYIDVHFVRPAPYRIALYTVSGSVVSTAQGTNGLRTRLDLPSVNASGIYILRARVGEFTTIRRMMIAR